MLASSEIVWVSLFIPYAGGKATSGPRGPKIESSQRASKEQKGKKKDLE